MASGKEAFIAREAASVYVVLLNLLKTRKWVLLNLTTDDVYKAIYKFKSGLVVVTSVEIYLEPVSGGGGVLLAKYFIVVMRSQKGAGECPLSALPPSRGPGSQGARRRPGRGLGGCCKCRAGQAQPSAATAASLHVCLVQRGFK